MRPFLERPVVCLISSGGLTDENFYEKHPGHLKLAATACEAGISIIQIREKELSTKNLTFFTRAIVNLARGTNTIIVVSERFDIALACDADGVHLPSNAMRVSVIRPLVPKSFLIGASTHSEEELSEAYEGGADFAVFGPVFETPGKSYPVGIEELDDVCRKFQGFPILALGGIDESNIDQVLGSEAAGFAAIRFLNNPEVLSVFGTKVKR